MTTYTTLETSQLRTDYSKSVLVYADPIWLDAGLTYVATGRWACTSDIGSLMGLRLRARHVGAGYRYGVWSTTNQLGVENGHPDVTDVYGRWLFGAIPVSGLWQFELVGQAGRTEPELRGEYVQVTSAALTVYPDGKVGGCEWRHTDPDVFVQSPGNGGPTSGWVLSKTWQAPAGTSSVRLYTGVELSSVSTGNHNPFAPQIVVYANQVPDLLGTPVKSWQDYKQVEIPGKLHHYKHHTSLTLDGLVPTADGAGPWFRYSVQVEWAPYNGVDDRHGGVVNGPTLAGPYTAGHAYPLEYTP